MAGKGIDVLGSLVRLEQAAAEAYERAAERAGEGPGAEELRQLHEEHRYAADALRPHTGQKAEGAGDGGPFARAAEGAGPLSHESLQALQEGEREIIRTYERALGEKGISEACRELIQSRLLPQTQDHLPILDHLLQLR